MEDFSLQHISTYRPLEQNTKSISHGASLLIDQSRQRKHQVNGLQSRRLLAAGTEDWALETDPNTGV